jgi:hypothetical protein
MPGYVRGARARGSLRLNKPVGLAGPARGSAGRLRAVLWRRLRGSDGITFRSTCIYCAYEPSRPLHEGRIMDCANAVSQHPQRRVVLRQPGGANRRDAQCSPLPCSIASCITHHRADRGRELPPEGQVPGWRDGPTGWVSSKLPIARKAVQSQSAVDNDRGIRICSQFRRVFSQF